MRTVPENFPPGREAPGDLELLRRFVNTLNMESGEDRVSTPSDLAAWLTDHGFPITGATRAQWRRAIGLRDTLRQLAAANHDGRHPDPAAVASVNAVAARRPSVVQMDPSGATHMRPADGTVDAWLGWVIAVVHEAESGGAWRRMKSCPHCHWLFYDHSKNRGGNWCSMKACGQRLKAKSYRRRSRTE